MSDFRVFLGATTGRVSGVDVFSVNLVRGLVERGVQAEILLTEPHEPYSDYMPFPEDVTVTRLAPRSARWSMRWKEMVQFLETRAPCVYVPNYDWHYSCVSPRLSSRVAVCGIVHSDDPMHYQHAERLGAYWDAIVCVSQAVLEQTATLDPAFQPRLHRVPYGVQVPAAPLERPPRSGEPLQICYAGRLVHHQKRAMDLASIAHELDARKVPFELRIAGAGDDEAEIRAACAESVRKGQVHFLGTVSNRGVLELMEQSEVFLLPSAFEGLPVSLLEAMGRGCVPVATDSRSGIPELVDDDVSGFRVPMGDIAGFADRLARLQREPELRQKLSRGAWEKVHRGGFRIEDMVESYHEIFSQALSAAAEGRYRRPRGPVLPPEHLEPELTWRGRLPDPLWKTERFARRVYHGLRRRGVRVLRRLRGLPVG